MKAQQTNSTNQSDTTKDQKQEVQLSLRKTADLHDVSASYLSRRVRAGEPAKGYDLTEYVTIKDGEVQGFSFPADYPLLNDCDYSASSNSSGDSKSQSSNGSKDSNAVTTVGTGDGKAGMPPVVDVNNASSEEEKYDDTGEGESLSSAKSSGFARTTREFHAGKTTWGRLQQRGSNGEWEFLTRIYTETPRSIEWVAEVFGSGQYRLYRLEGEKQVQFTFSISRRTPSEIEKKLAVIDEREDQIAQLQEALDEEYERRSEIRRELWDREGEVFDLEMKVADLESELLREEQKRKNAERKLARKEEREEEEPTRRELKKNIRDLKREKEELQHEHELEIIRLKKGTTNELVERLVDLLEELVEAGKENPRAVKLFFKRGLNKLGLGDLLA